MTKNKNGKNRKIEFIEYSKASLKQLSKDIVLSSTFIVFSSTKPIFSFQNGAWYVLFWYLISLLILLKINLINLNYNIECKANKKWHKRHGYKNMKIEEIHKIRNYDKARIQLDGWTFYGIKLLSSLIFVVILLVIAVLHQHNDYYHYMTNEKDFFIGILMDTFVITVFTGYYSLLLDNFKSAKGLKNKTLSLIMLNISNGSFLKKVFWNIAAMALLVLSLIYSFYEFSIFMPLIIGGLYVIFLLNPIKDIAN